MQNTQPPQSGASPINVNPVTNPTHPAHELATRHLGHAIGHLLIGDSETAADHLHQAIEHTLRPDAAMGAAQQPKKTTKKKK